MTNTILSSSRRAAVTLVLAAMLLPATTLSGKDDGPPPTSGPPSFQPGDISIGEPIPLPFAAPKADRTADGAVRAAAQLPAASGPPTPAASRTVPLGTLPLAAETAAPAAAPLGKGWLGLAIAESSVPGRWAVDEVAPTGPAAAAGIRPGDEVRAINGLPLRNADEVSEALTAIAPGQSVRLAIGRDDQVGDLVIVATDRPATNTARTWQSSPEPTATPTQREAAPAPTASSAPPPFAAAPPSFAAAPPVAAATADAPAVAAPPPGGGSRAEPVPAAATRDRVPANLPAPAEAPATGATGRTALGVRTVPIDAGLQARFNLPAATGAYVIGVVQDLPASRAGVPPGSVIVSLDERPVRSPDELTRLVIAGPVGKPVAIQYVLPGGTAHRADVTLQSLERPLEEALVGSPTPVATEVPSLEPGPTPATARRPAVATDTTVIRAEIRDLRARLEQLERRLEAAAR